MDSKAWQDMTLREKDALVAEKVMGWSVRDVERERTHDGSTYFSPSADGGLPHYTTTDHPQVIAKMRADGWAYCVGGAATGPIGASFEFGRPHDPDHVPSYRTVVNAATEGLAICESSLRAIGVLS